MKDISRRNIQLGEAYGEGPNLSPAAEFLLPESFLRERDGGRAYLFSRSCFLSVKRVIRNGRKRKRSRLKRTTI